MALSNEAFPYPGSAPLGADHLEISKADGQLADEKTATPSADLMKRVVQGAHDTLDRLAETAAPQVQRLDEGLSEAGDALHAKAGQMRDTSEQWAESLRCTVRDHPLAAVAAALALGAVIARLTR